MGLDQSLVKKTYFYDKSKVEIKIDGKVIDSEKVQEISEEIGYWRKSNHIHNWFVNNVQNGEDDCRNYYVSREQLQELLDICREVDLDHRKAKELLPCIEGFFFGSNHYDDWYFKSIMDTIEILKNAIKAYDNNTLEHGIHVSIEYSSSW